MYIHNTSTGYKNYVICIGYMLICIIYRRYKMRNKSPLRIIVVVDPTENRLASLFAIIAVAVCSYMSIHIYV